MINTPTSLHRVRWMGYRGSFVLLTGSLLSECCDRRWSLCCDNGNDDDSPPYDDDDALECLGVWWPLLNEWLWWWRDDGVCTWIYGKERRLDGEKKCGIWETHSWEMSVFFFQKCVNNWHFWWKFEFWPYSREILHFFQLWKGGWIYGVMTMSQAT